MGHGLDETHSKWGAISGLLRLYVGGLWQMGGLRKEIKLCSKEQDVSGFMGMVGMVGFD